MSAAAKPLDETLLPVNKNKSAKNIYWLETIFYQFKCDIKKINLHDYFISDLFNISTIEDEFFFKASKSSPTLFIIQLHRVLVNPKKRPDDGCRLDIWFTLDGIRRGPELRTMNYGDDYVSLSYEIDIMSKKVVEEWTLKCVFKLFEISCLPNVLCRTQNEWLQILEWRSDWSGRKARELAFLLKRKSLEDVFSGRQKMAFSFSKNDLLKKVLEVVSEIARKFAMKIKKMPYKTELDLGVYLDYIHKKKLHGISKTDSALLYLDAHRYGLDFLRIECTEFMLKNLDREFIVDVLMVSDIVQDDTLMSKVLDVVISNNKELWYSHRWWAMLDSGVAVCHSLTDAITRKVIRHDHAKHRLQQLAEAQKTGDVKD